MNSSAPQLFDRQPYLQSLLHYMDAKPSSSVQSIAHPDPSVNNLDDMQKRSLRRAAVLIAVTRPTATQGSNVILTLRSEKLRSHAGQVALPGGSRDAQDKSYIDTALRESEEEIGLLQSRVDVIGQLGKMALPSGFYVTPIVGLIDAEQDFQPCPIEVAEIFQTPLELLLNPASYSRSNMTYKNKSTTILEIQYGKFRIWGATAAILYHLAKEVENFQNISAS